MKLYFLIAGLTVMVLFKKHNLAGEWSSNGKNNTRTILQFTKNGHFTIIAAGGHIENKGLYILKNDSFYIRDSNCGMKVTGLYALHFFTEDAVQFNVVTDKCSDRSSEINGGIIVRSLH